ncbi:MAG: class I SAM-dependent methyltransferase [Rhodospirillaceae bacterium]|nr:class I SAM-dependent methyltransferase [Rhodospirillaceae bacterium]
MLGRRNLFTTAGAAAAGISSFFAGRAVEAKAAVKKVVGDVELRGADGRLERFGSLDLESQMDFTAGFREFNNRGISRVAAQRFQTLMKEKGMDPKVPVTFEQMLPIAENDPIIGMSAKTWLANQQVTWKTLQDYFHANADMYLAEMEAADKSGPGSLELNPTMAIPDYTRYEIHIQPGGYVGDPFAGHMYHYGTNSFYIGAIGHNEQDQIHKGTANNIPAPADGKVKRILEMGCGVGQMACALKERFPDAEVWAIDIGGPMVRYGHMRARDLGIDVNFAQRLAENTGFPDGYFDMTTSYIIHHELPQTATRAVIAEAQRITRSGGVYYPVDFNTGGNTGPAYGLFRRWWDHRWNQEVWSREYHTLDFNAEIVKGGFTHIKETKAALPGFGARHFVRNA